MDARIAVAILSCALAFGGAMGSRTGTASASCPTRGTWPGPNGSHYLNQFADGKCNYYIDVNYLNSLTMDTGTWYQQDVININSGATVTVAQNVTLNDNFFVQPSHFGGYININGTLDFESGSSFQVQCTRCGIFVSWLSPGTLIVNGTAAAPVSMSGTGPGSWMGLAFRAAGSTPATGSVHYLHLSGGGGSDPSFSVSAGIYINHSSPTISNSVVDTSSGNGIEIDGYTSAPVLTADAITNNVGYGIQYDFLSTTLRKISGLSMSGNGQNAIRMVSPTATQYVTSVTWPNLRYPIIDDVFTTVEHAGRLTVGPGTTVKFGKQSAFQVTAGGMLTLNGTKTKPILLTSEAATPAPGDWGGVQLLGGGSASLTYVRVSYAGGTMPGYPSVHAGVQVTGATSPTISNSTIEHSAGNDVEVSSGARPVLHNDNLLAVPTGAFGVVNDGWVSGQPLVDATTDWWADPSGPFNAKSNPGGRGTSVSDGVSFSPWLTSPAPAP